MTKEGPRRDVNEPRFRPNATWVCGHSTIGRACAHGPSANGKCGNQSHASLHDQEKDSDSACSTCVLACGKKGDTNGAQSPWRECEAMASAPCVPVRSAWSFRNTLALNLAILTTGILLCLMVFPQREATFVPGGLASKHAQILENRVVSERCSLCHPNSHTISTSSVASGSIATQDELCTRCHEDHLPNLHLRSPHDMQRETLKQLTLNALSSRGLLVSKKSQTFKLQSQNTSNISELEVTPQFDTLLASSKKQTACANCHIEHHGRDNPLQAITDARCQACHARQFESFENGHPEFDNYPVAQSRRIAFTHQAHHEKHFAKKNESFQCSKCHLDSNQRGGVGSVFRTLSFETACARCHNEAINAASVDGWVVLQLPSIKPDDTQQAGLGLTGWPTTAQFGYDGTVPLVMRALLMADEECEQAINLLPLSGEIKSIPNFATVGRDATISIAVGTQSLIKDISAGGHAAWRKRLESVLKQSVARDLSPREAQLLNNLCAGLPPDVFRQMQQTWFSDRTNDIVFGESETPSGALAPTQLVSVQDDDLLLGSDIKPLNPTKPGGPQKLTKLRGAIHVVQGGWYLDNETLALRYMPRGHNDPTLAAWSEFATLLASTRDVDTSKNHTDFSRQVPGGCTQCHVLNSSALGQSPWMAVSKPATARSITKFDHTPHLTLPALADCRYCHQLDSGSGAKTNLQFVTKNVQGVVDSQLPTCEFKSMHLEQCSACHRPNAANAGCTQCHNYHVTGPTALR